ncbi:MAG: DedA family protein [Deltaproteobacteria bacterium]|nr:DedA family protein [Deltaproteobacteria bacterium]
MAVDHYLYQFGYLALFIGAVIEGETFVLLAGLAAYNGILSLQWVLFWAYFGAMVGDQSFFFLGRLRGREFLDRRKNWRDRCGKVFHWLHTHQIMVLLFYRFIYGFRSVTPFVIGLTTIRTKFFIAINALVSLAWTILVAVGGYYLGYLLDHSGINPKHLQVWLFLGSFFTLAVIAAAKVRK